MVSYKKVFYAFTMMVTLLNVHVTKSAELSEMQAKKYINHLLDSLFIPYNHPVTYQHHLHTFLQEITNDVIKNRGKYPHFYSFSKVYDDNQISQLVINESLSFIEKCARTSAIKETESISDNQQLLVDKIVNSIMSELINKTKKASIITEGIFSNYYGTALTNKIHALVEKAIKKEAARLEKLNARTKCTLCTTQFNTKVNKKISLKCGHNLCLSCLKSLWYQMGSSIACSRCNYPLNIRDYVQGLWVTPINNH